MPRPSRRSRDKNASTDHEGDYFPIKRQRFLRWRCDGVISREKDLGFWIDDEESFPCSWPPAQPVLSIRAWRSAESAGTARRVLQQHLRVQPFLGDSPSSLLSWGPATYFHVAPTNALDSPGVKEQKKNIEHKGNAHMTLFVKDIASLAAIALFVSSFSLIIHAF